MNYIKRVVIESFLCVNILINVIKSFILNIPKCNLIKQEVEDNEMKVHHIVKDLRMLRLING